MSERADDALAAAEFVRNRAAVDPGRVGLLGFSEGGTVAFLAASRSRSIAFLVSLCGPVVPGDQCNLTQHRKREELLISEIFGDELRQAASEQIRLDVAQMRRIYDLVKANCSDDEVRGQFFAWQDEERKRLDASRPDAEHRPKGWFTASRPPTPTLWNVAHTDKYLAEACAPADGHISHSTPEPLLSSLEFRFWRFTGDWTVGWTPTIIFRRW